MNLIKKFLEKKKVNTQVFDISLERMQISFEKMEQAAGWDTSKELYWGYFFLDHDLKKLEAFGKNLEKEGYQVVEIRQVEGNSLFLLHAEEHSVHSAQSLFEQCHKLTELAQDNSIEIFDGWDACQIAMDKGLVE